MRFFSFNQKFQTDHQRKRRWLKRLRRQAQLRALGLAILETEGRTELKHARPRPVPAEMCIIGNYEQVAAWLYRLRMRFSQSIRSARRGRALPSIRTYFDYARIRRMTPEVALLIASEYDRLCERTGLRLGAYNRRKWQPDVQSLLSDIGFFELLGIDLATERPPNGAYVRMSRFESGDKLQPQAVGQFAIELVRKLVQLDASTVTDNAKLHKTLHLVAALIEATENTKQHAYSDALRKDPGCVPKWWLTGAVYKEQKRLVIVVYDHGVSIPGKVAEVADVAVSGSSQWVGRDWFAKAMARFQRNRVLTDLELDEARLRFAMKYGHSSTKFPNRGKGLPVISEVVSHCAHGRLTIISRHAKYVAETGRRVVSERLSTPLAGTLIIWDLSFKDGIGAP
jgi:hypothetical protein